MAERARDWPFRRAAASIGDILRGSSKVLPVAPTGLRIYAVGDVHGRADCLARVFAEIDTDLRRHPVDEIVEIYIGDYIDRGPDSRTVIDLLIGRARRRPVYPVLGNHEEMLLGSLVEGRMLDQRTAALSQIWRVNGALETLESYGVPVGGLPTAEAWPELLAAFRQVFPQAHRSFLEQGCRSVSFGSYFFVHAGIRPGIPIGYQHRADLLWIREPFLRSQANHGAIIVHGHTPVPEPELRTNRINLDTGAYLTGCLGCVALEGNAQHVVCG
ncbi:metallophosphoesterase family protein [Methylobacterium sp. R2-1]|uniref:metallophosphoesterase family protein n=1 Tax=Methylobacterium sp. R2-1 TaxID=2587064 RepID=UPI0017AD5BB3|nr:metallophosphoesterase family protein [Methylobacterium sp. R2-1]MBB2964914.1 serine/threonine protein phosphatase 1 [Methylobacterium sp. R2-1]